MSNMTPENSNKKQRLGRGLGSLLGGAVSSQGQETQVQARPMAQPLVPPQAPAPSTVPVEARIWTVSIDKLQASQFQPRTHFDKAALEDLANSIRANGILQPIVARRLDQQRLEIIAGERRWRAAQLAGLHEVPVILKTLKNQDALELAIIENIQREDLNPVEEAEAYQRLITEFNLTQQQVSEKVGKERATVANTLRLLSLAPRVRQMLTANEITAGHAKVLLSIQEPEKQVKMAERVKAEALSVRQLEKVSKSIDQTPEFAKNTKMMESNVTQRLISGLSDELQKILGTKVNIDYQSGKGKIAVHFYSDEELTQLVERLKEGCQKH